MKHVFLIVAIGMAIVSCGQLQSRNIVIPLGDQKKIPGEAVATFGEGCFWHTELVFQSLEGVRDAVSGYSGGVIRNPDYEMVSSGNTGYAECVNVYYDPKKVSFQTLVDAFFASHDPTQVNRQGPDEGSQYRSVIFYRNEKEKLIIYEKIERLKNDHIFKKPIATEVLPFKAFYKAEDYHQEYIHNHPGNPYVQSVSIPDFIRFKNSFKGNFKKEVL